MIFYHSVSFQCRRELAKEMLATGQRFSCVQGVARNLLRGEGAKEGIWGQSPQKPETNANFHRRVRHALMSPLATPLVMLTIFDGTFMDKSDSF